MEVEEAALAVGRRYVHEKIKKIITELVDDESENVMVEDPIRQTAVAVEFTINRYITQSSSPPTADQEETLDDTTISLHFLDGFLDDDDDSPWLEELDSLVLNKVVTAQTLEEIKKTILRRRSRIRNIALMLKRQALGIDMELDLLTWYSDDQEDVVSKETVEDEEEMSDQDDVVDDDNYEEEEMLDIEDDNNDVRKSALRSSVEALETRIFGKIEDLEMMLKYSSCGYTSCMVCLEEFSIDDAAGGISTKTMPCSHVFHSGCIERWLGKTYTCPICRYEMPTADD